MVDHFQHYASPLGRGVLRNSECGAKLMTQKKDRDRVMAEITLAHLLRLAQEHGCSLSREARVFLNEEGRAYEMWKHMMQAGEEFIASSLLQITSRQRHTFAAPLS